MTKHLERWLDSPACAGGDLKKVFLKHASSIRPHEGFYRVTEPLKVFKAARRDSRRWGDDGEVVIVALTIPKGARIYADPVVFRSSAACNRKMRATEALVDSIWSLKGKPRKRAVSDHSSSFEYKPGKTVRPYHFTEHSAVCAGGIHFFMNFKDAYYYL